MDERHPGNKVSGTINAELPIDTPRNYRTWVNQPNKDDDLTDVRTSVVKSKPFGTMKWMERVVERFKLQGTLRERGRPKDA